MVANILITFVCGLILGTIIGMIIGTKICNTKSDPYNIGEWSEWEKSEKWNQNKS